MFEREAKPSDRFASPFKNDNEARVANNGALPPDLSVLAKARGVHTGAPWYVAPFLWLKEILTGYQEGGADYIHALLVGYAEPPPGFKLADGMNYNNAFPGHQIAMPPPLADEAIEYTDGTPQTVSQYASDVSAYLMWAADTKLEERKRMGFRVMIYLLVLTLLVYLAKRSLWTRIKH
jgi:cytochrome c1